jgi:SAM-dependent methyltransferase
LGKGRALSREWPFDSEETQRYTNIRQAFIAEFLRGIRTQTELGSAVDVGCGVGHFTKFLADLGFRAMGVDGREENVGEARRRYPNLAFATQDVESPLMAEVGTFDLVLCVGLLYHLENPFRAIRNLYALTNKLTIVESMCAPGHDAEMVLLNEGREHDQGLNFVAFYPTEPCLIKMLYCAGFPFVYQFRLYPADEQFRTSRLRFRSRTFLVASRVELDGANLLLAEKKIKFVVSAPDLWTTPAARFLQSSRSSLGSLRRAAARLLKPWGKVPSGQSEAKQIQPLDE